MYRTRFQILKEQSFADLIVMVVLVLMAVGTVFVFSASANISRDLELHRFYEYPGLRQILFFPLAVMILYFVSRIDYRRLKIHSSFFKSPVVYLLAFSVLLLILVLIPGIGTEINRARRWIRFVAGPATISFQPSELAKWAMIFFLTGFCVRFRDSLGLYWKRFVPVCVLIAAVTGLIIIEDFGTAGFVALLSFLVLLIGGVKFRYLLTLMPFGVLAFFAAILQSPMRIQRIKAFLNPAGHAASAAYQANQSLIALGSGGLFGKGLGGGISKYGHLPEDTTDFIFAIIGEELGFIGTAVVIMLFIGFVCLGIMVVRRCEDRFGRLLAAGIVLSIGIQAAINIGVVTVVLPTKGIPLPFVSAGGTSMLLSAAAVGVLVNIAKQTANNKLAEGEYD